MENKMEELARLAGLELEEEFRMNNYSTKYKITKHGFMYWSDDYQQWNYICGIEELFLGNSQIVKIPKSILDDAEKRYLSAVIKPFRSRVRWIRKYYLSCQEFIQICVFNGDEALDWMTFELPYFKRGTMYQGMEIDKRYTIQQLGL